MNDVMYVIYTGRGDVSFAYDQDEMRTRVAHLRALPLTSHQKQRGLTEQPVHVFQRVGAELTG